MVLHNIADPLTRLHFIFVVIPISGGVIGCPRIGSPCTRFPVDPAFSANSRTPLKSLMSVLFDYKQCDQSVE